MLTIHNLTKRYGDDLVLDRVGFTISAGERVGLVGPNGCGKSTLLRIIAGVEHADAGSITRVPASLPCGYLPQGWDGPPSATVADALGDGHACAALQARLAEIERRMATPGLPSAALQALLEEYGAAQQQFEAVGGYIWAHHAASVLAGLGLAELAQDTPVAQLSGGQKTRLGLARLLLAAPQLLLIDEPTNHLDAEAVSWLEAFLAGYDGSALIVSHDRAFLDRVATRILELRKPEAAGARPQLSSYSGAYRDYADALAAERARQQARWQDQQQYLADVTEDIQRLKRHAQVNPHSPGAKKMGRASKARERKLERYERADEWVERPRQSWGVSLDFGAAADGARAVLRVEGVYFSYTIALDDQRPKTKDQMDTPRSLVLGPWSPLLDNISFELSYGERVALVGPNGAGKTTLLRIIAGQLAPGGGQVRLGAGVQVGYLSQEHEALDRRDSVLDALRATVPWGVTECRGFLHRYLFAGDDVLRPIYACSYGERARLALALLVARGCSFLVLDEPINHLDIPSRERFEQALAAFDGTILAVAHDRYFLARFAERVLALRGGRLLDYPGGYEDFLAANAPF
ncbi:MAG TPA: ABC-F family ATP-binding cassette domain-containing protein [Roseiflexaceae bacterium]|nr:ABC-F family ATP-binding cassette domain-containing protein [Roseiflexaceae bacterium]